MSSITIISGLLGNGKTLYAVHLMRLAKAEGRLVLAKNVNGLDPSVAKDWPHPMDEWKSIPPGSILFVDESQDFLATQGKGGSPEWVKEFSKVRHVGIELVFITQDPRFLDPWVRRLCNRHIHVMRKMGMQMAVIHEWDRVQDNPVDYHSLQSSVKTTWKYPKELFALYKSANIHTVKRRIPKKLFFYLLVVVVTILLIVYAAKLIFHPAPVEAAKLAAASSVAGGKGPSTKVTAGEYAARFTPAVASMPWSAPAYSDLKATDFPVLYCVDSEAKGCQCFTQQITRYYIDEKICKVIVKDGVYDPFQSQRKDLIAERNRERSYSDRDDTDRRLSRLENASDWPGRAGERAEAQPPASPARSPSGSNPIQVPAAAARMDAARW